MSIGKVLKKVEKIYDTLKVVFLVSAILLIPLFYYSGLYKNLGFFIWLATAWLLLVLNILLDIQKQVKEKPDRRVILETGDDALPKMLELIKSRKRNRQHVRIFAITLASVWPRLKDILRNTDYSNLDIKLLQVDPILEGMEDTNPKWRGEAKYIFEDIQGFVESNSVELINRNISIKVKRYKYGPCIHGYLISEEYKLLGKTKIGRENCFFSLCGWQSKVSGVIELEGSPNFYEEYNNRNDKTQRLYFDVFENWFNHFFEDSKET